MVVICYVVRILILEPYLKISYLNDFIFCPLSIYYHELYGQTSHIIYHGKPQIDGKAAHASIDNATYSTHSEILQGISVYCERLKLYGCIDLLDVRRKLLTERKKKIVKIYHGYIFQLYAQYYCLEEMGYDVTILRFHSIDDNIVHHVSLPCEDDKMREKFYQTLDDIRTFDPDMFLPTNPQKCNTCIYHNLCDRPLEESC